MLCFFRSLIDFDRLSGHLILGSDQVSSGQVILTFLKNQVEFKFGFGSRRVRQVFQVRSDSDTST
jgi:hypothetical protein